MEFPAFAHILGCARKQVNEEEDAVAAK